VSDAPRHEPEQLPAHIVEEPISRPDVPWKDPAYDDEDSEAEDNPARNWDGRGWPHPDMFWP
jgi:hypothetical protein